MSCHFCYAFICYYNECKFTMVKKKKTISEEMRFYMIKGRISVLNRGSLSPVRTLPQEGYLCMSLHLHHRVWDSDGTCIPGEGSSERQAIMPKINHPPRHLVLWAGVPGKLVFLTG